MSLQPQVDDLGALSAAVAQLVSDHGRRPTSASSSWLGHGCVVTALEGFLTPAEHALVDKGEDRGVRQLRRAFGEAITGKYVCAAEDALGRKVIAHRSEVVCASDMCLEIFLLANEERIPSVGPLPAPGPQFTS